MQTNKLTDNPPNWSIACWSASQSVSESVGLPLSHQFGEESVTHKLEKKKNIQIMKRMPKLSLNHITQHHKQSYLHHSTGTAMKSPS